MWPKSAASWGKVCRDAGKTLDPDANDITSAAPKSVCFRWGQDLEAADLLQLGALLIQLLLGQYAETRHMSTVMPNVSSILRGFGVLKRLLTHSMAVFILLCLSVCMAMCAYTHVQDHCRLRENQICYQDQYYYQLTAKLKVPKSAKKYIETMKRSR